MLRKHGQAMLRWLGRVLKGRGLTRLPFADKAYERILSWLAHGQVLADIQGSKMHLDLDAGGLHRRLFVTGVHERQTTALFKELIKPGMVVLDIGAHAGYYTLLAARLTGPAGKVYAFEPAPANYALLLKNIDENEYAQVVALRKAVADMPGRARFFVAAGHDAIQGMAAPMAPSKEITVETLALDAFFENGQRVDVIKIDVEGGEFSALKGMQRILNENRDVKLVIEFSPSLLRELGSRPEQLLDFLEEEGFTISIIDEREGSVTPADAATVLARTSNEREFVNLFAARAGRA